MLASKTFYFTHNEVDYSADVTLFAEDEGDYLSIFIKEINGIFEEDTGDQVESTDEFTEIIEDLIDSKHKQLTKLFHEEN